MSDLLIRGMEKPQDWRDCIFGNGAAQCNLRPALGYCNSEICPLISIPEHGRLIDADELKADDYTLARLQIDFDDDGMPRSWREFIDLDDAPTAIPASK